MKTATYDRTKQDLIFHCAEKYYKMKGSNTEQHKAHPVRRMMRLQGSRVRPIWSQVRPNFSRVWLTKIPGRTGASSHSRKEKKVSVTQKLYVVQQKTHPLGLYRGLNQSEIVKGGPPLIGRGPDIPVCVCARWQMRHVCCCSQTERKKEVSSRDACSVANLARFSAFVDPHSNFLFSQKSN